MNDPEKDASSEITAHFRVRNEEKFIRSAILAILPLVKRVLVYDTGSTDRTLEIVSSIQSKKIEIVQRKFSHKRELRDIRNEMLEQTTTEWSMIVDGDEIYPPEAVRRLGIEIQKIPPAVHRIVIRRLHLAGSFNLIASTHAVGRIFRTRQIRWRGNSGGSETPYVMGHPLASQKQFSMSFPKDIFFFHCHNFSRSSKDVDLGALRTQRKLFFPVLPYFGPWPQVLEAEDVATRPSLKIFLQSIALNAGILWDFVFETSRKIKKRLFPRPADSSKDPALREPLTVLFLETSLRIGGTEHVITQLIRRFDRKRVYPIVCCFYEPGEFGKELMKEGIPVFYGLAKSRWDLGMIPRLLKFLREEQVDVLFMVNQPLIQFCGTLCGLLYGVPVQIAAIRSTGKINRIQRRLWINRLTFPWITRVTALSQMHKTYLVEKEKIDARKIEIIPNGVDLARFSAARDNGTLRFSLGIPGKAPLVGIVAMLRPEKGHDVFLKAAERVSRQMPEAHFLIIGEGPEHPRLIQWAKELGIEKKIHFLGARHDVPAILHSLSVAVLSSRPVVETLSNAVLEYMAAAKPVVATRVGSLPEQIEEGKTGFMVEPGDFEAMAEKIVTLLKDNSLVARMGQAGRERVETHYGIDQMVRQTEDLFERLLGRKSTR